MIIKDQKHHNHFETISYQQTELKEELKCSGKQNVY